MNKMAIRLLTSKETPDRLDDDDNYLLKALDGRLTYRIVPWGDLSDSTLLTVIRSTWDYHRQSESFLNFLSSIPALYNPYDIVKWNIHKSYLLEVSAITPIIPTQLIPIGRTPDLLVDVLKQQQWNKAVLKPAISLGSLDSIVIRNQDTEEALNLLAHNQQRDFFLQPFIEAITTQGEVSFIYIDGRYSHAVRKLPKEGDFRSQPEFGSLVTLYDATADQLHRCDRLSSYLTQKFNNPLLYARFDFIMDSVPLLIEIELIEPCLYFQYAPAAADRLVDALIKRLPH